MGARWQPTGGGLRIEGTGAIHGITADLRDINELAPVLTALAALADSPSEFTGIGHMRLHESDRLAALAAEIGALGGQVTELPDGLRIQPRPAARGNGPVRQPRRPPAGHGRGRARARRARPARRNAATVAKTFPAFRALWQQMLGQAP